MIHPVRGRATFAAFRSGSSGRSGPVRARYVPSTPGDERTCVAYAVSRKVGNAVTRNRIRRRLRAAVAELDRRQPLVPGAYLVSSGPEAAATPFPELLSRVDVALRQAAPHRQAAPATEARR